MPQDFGPAHRELQDRYDTRRLADRLGGAAGDELAPSHAAFIEQRDMFFVATVDEDGLPQCSYKGGLPGFVRVLDPSTIAFPVYDGNGMFLTAGNIIGNGHVGLLFIDLESGSRLRVNGTATIDPDDPLTPTYPGALFVVRVRAAAIFANCRRYVHRYQLVERSVFVPEADHTPPVPDWKRISWFDGALPAGDPALDEANADAPSIPQFPTA